MMTLEQKISQDIKAALINKDTVALDALRFLKSALHNEAIARKKKELTDEEALAAIATQAKKRKESITAFRDGGREEMAKKEETELKIISRYLPAQLDEAEIKKVVQEVTAATEDKNFGLAMKQVMARLKGQADGKVVSRLVKEALAP